MKSFSRLASVKRSEWIAILVAALLLYLVAHFLQPIEFIRNANKPN
jgi:hypothetical protein